MALSASTAAELQCAVEAQRPLLIAAEEGVELPLPAPDRDDSLSLALREAWEKRVLFAKDDLAAAADKTGMRLGVPDWFVSQLPKEALAALHGPPAVSIPYPVSRIRWYSA